MHKMDHQKNIYHRTVTKETKDSLYYVSKNICPDSLILDLGCWEGALGSYLVNKKNCVVDGVELNPQAADIAKKTYRNVLVGDLQNIDLSLLNEKYDYIVCADILEHLTQPDNILNMLDGILRPNGRVIVSVPNIGYGGVISELISGEFSYRNNGILDKTHYKFFTRSTIIELLKNVGLNILTVDTVNAAISESEFCHTFNSPRSSGLIDILSEVKDSGVYQFVLTCSFQENLENTFDDTADCSLKFIQKIYWKKENSEYSEANSVCKSLSLQRCNDISFELPDFEVTSVLRIDLLDFVGIINVYDMSITDYNGNVLLDFNELVSKSVSSLGKWRNIESCFEFESYHIDSSIEIKIGEFDGFENFYYLKISSQKLNEVISLERKVRNLKNTNDDFFNLLGVSKIENDSLTQELNMIKSSLSWTLTKPLRVLSSLLRGEKKYIERLCENHPLLGLIKGRGIFYFLVKSLRVLLTNDPRKVKGIISNIAVLNREYKNRVNSTELYELWLEKEIKEKAKKEKIIENKRLFSPRFSILIPTYNTNVGYLKDCIDSVINQSYQEWEICIVDDASGSSDTKDVLRNYAQIDNRIKVHFNESNQHISKSTNFAYGMSSGDYILLLDHDDMLAGEALLELVYEINQNIECDLFYSDEDHINVDGERKEPFFKPDWSPTLLLSQNYIGHLVCIKRSLMETIGGFRIGYEGAQDYDLMLRASLAARSIKHIPKILYHWREHPNSTASNSSSKPYAHVAGQKALQDFVGKKYPKRDITIEDSGSLFTYRTNIYLKNDTTVSIIIPTKDKVELLKACVDSINKCEWGNFELIIINNGSVEDVTFKYFSEIERNGNVKIVDADIEFNWSKLNNIGASYSDAEFLVFLNNDTVIIDNNWLQTLCSWASLDDVAVVGPTLLYEDNTIQHAGVVVGMGGWADHVFKGELPIHKVGPFVSPAINRNVLAVTGACQVIEKKKFDKIGGFDENFIICGSDVEICIRAHEMGYQNLYIADTSLYHLESKSRSSYVPENDFELSRLKYEPYRTQVIDPFYNKNLDIMKTSPVVKL